MTCSAFLAGLLLLKLDQNFLVICGPYVSIKKARTRVKIIVANALPIAVIEFVRAELTLSNLTKF